MYPIDDTLCTGAADRMERLAAEVEQLQQEVKEFADLRGDDLAIIRQLQADLAAARERKPAAIRMTDKLPEEDNFAFCKRFAESIPPEDILRRIFDRLIDKGGGGFSGWTKAWSWIGDVMSHGSGISGAIVTRFMTHPATTPAKPSEGER
jgi:hypothetical protein